MSTTPNNNTPTQHIDGDVTIGRHATISGKADIQGNARVGGNLKVEGWLEAKNVKSANKGLFATQAALNNAYPHPHDGWFAGVSASAADITALGLSVQTGKSLFRMYVGSGGEWVCEPIDKLYEITIDDSQVANLGEDLVDLSQIVSGHGESISSLTTTQTTQGNALNTHTGQISALTERMSSAEGSIDDIEEQVSNLAGLADTVQGHGQRLGEAEGIIQDLGTAIDEIVDNIGKEGGIAPLGDDGLVPAEHLPAPVKEVVEIDRMVDGVETQDTGTGKTVGEDGCLLVLDTATNLLLLAVQKTPLQQVGGIGEAKPEQGETITGSLGEYGYKYYAAWGGCEEYGELANGGIRPTSGKAYICKADNKTYRWTGEGMAPVGSSLELGKDEGEAYPGDAGAELEGAVAANAKRAAGIGILPFDGIEEKCAGDFPASIADGEVWYVKEDATFLTKADGSVGVATGYVLASSKPRQDRIFRCDNRLYRYDGKELVEVGGSAIGNTYNLTNEVPTPDPAEIFYKIDHANAAYCAPKVVHAQGKATLGMQLTFAIAPKSWKTYQYVGTSVAPNDTHFFNPDNWLDLAGMSVGEEPLVIINALCEDMDYTLSTAVQALINLEAATGIKYRKEGLIITYRRDAQANKWETKQYQGKLNDMAATNEEQWKDIGGGGGIVEAATAVEKDNTRPVTSGAVYEELQKKLFVDMEDQSTADDYVYQPVNVLGEAIGEPISIPRNNGAGQASGSVLNIYPETQAVWGAFGSRMTLRCAIKSVGFDGDTEIPGTIKTISILDALTRIVLWSDTVNAPSSTSAADYKFTFDFTDFITAASSKDFLIQATDADGNAKTRTITTTAVDVTCECISTLNYSSATALEVNGREKSLPMYKFANNVSTKQGILATTEIYYNGEWRTLGTATVVDSYSHNITINPSNLLGDNEKLAHGSHALRIQGKDLASGVLGNTIYTSVMCIDPNSEEPVVSMRYDDRNGGKVRLYDSVSVDIAAYTPGQTRTPVEVIIDDRVVTTANCEAGQTMSVSKQVQGYATDGTKSFAVYAKSGEVSTRAITLTVEGSAIDAAVKDGALISYDFSTRSNSETDHSIEDGGCEMTLEGCNYSSNGFVSVLGETALRIAENVKAEIPYAPFASTSLETSGAAIQMAFSTKSIKDKSAKLCECYDPSAGAGFYILGNEIVLAVLNGTPKQQRVRFKCGEKITVAIVVEPGTKTVTYKPAGAASGTAYSFVKLYVNGEECAAIGYQPGTSALRQTKTITFNSESGDFNLNYFIAYNSYM